MTLWKKPDAGVGKYKCRPKRAKSQMQLRFIVKVTSI